MTRGLVMSSDTLPWPGRPAAGADGRGHALAPIRPEPQARVLAQIHGPNGNGTALTRRNDVYTFLADLQVVVVVYQTIWHECAALRSLQAAAESLGFKINVYVHDNSPLGRDRTVSPSASLSARPW